MAEVSPIALQRVGPLAQLPALLAAHGVWVSELLDGLPITEADLRPEVQLPIAALSALLDRAAAHAGLEEVGLLLGKTQNHLVLGLVGRLMMSCDTLRNALGTFAAVQIVNSTAAAVYLHPAGDDYALGFGLYAPEVISSHIHDISAAVGLNLVNDLTGGAVRPLELLISRPVPARPDVYAKHFRCPVRFNEGQTCLILPGRSLGFRLPTADARLRQVLLGELQKQLAPSSVAARTRHALRPLLPAGAASHRQVAAHLNNMHPRTMGRRLEAENVTFEQLKDEVRLAVSRELLARTQIAVSDVAATLGYATPSAFVRAFRRWTGSSPSAWRRDMRSAASGGQALPQPVS